MIQEMQLGQSRPSGTTAVSIYSPTSGTWICKSIIVCNSSSSLARYSIYHDEDGTTYDETTALFFSVEIHANTTVMIDIFMAGSDPSGNVAVQTDTADALTFTMYGGEIR